MIVRITFFSLALCTLCVSFAQGEVKITRDSEYRYIDANGIPDHKTGDFPNSGNPNRISEQSYHYRIPLNPRIADFVTPLQGVNFGVALNGVPFDPGTAELYQGDSSWRYEALTGFVQLGIDENNAHVQPNGAYHYHGLPSGLLKNAAPNKHSPLVGWSADGFPIYALYGYKEALLASDIVKLQSSYALKKGERAGGPGGAYDGRFMQDFEYADGLGDLDECNGRVGITPEFPGGTYYYVITDEFPYIPRCFRGTPDASFRKTMHRGGPHEGGRYGPRQRPAPGMHPHPKPHHPRPRGDRFSFFGYAIVI